MRLHRSFVISGSCSCRLQGDSSRAIEFVSSSARGDQSAIDVRLVVCLEQAPRRYVPEQEKEGCSVREQGRRERNVQENLREDRAGYEEKGRRQVGGQAVPKSYRKTTYKHGDWREQRSDRSVALCGEKRRIERPPEWISVQHHHRQL